jgi:hypothetical protein
VAMPAAISNLTVSDAIRHDLGAGVKLRRRPWATCSQIGKS